MRILILFAALAVTTGCTIGWHELRAEAPPNGAWQCPASVTVAVRSGFTTNTYGPKPASAEYVEARTQEYTELANRAVYARCSTPGAGAALTIEVEEMQQLSALPQEFLTGLSFGLIPNKAVRVGQVHYRFQQGARSAVYAVDDHRVTHLLLMPVFWITLLNGETKQFKVALDDFISEPGK